jgi:hypothetical protein
MNQTIAVSASDLMGPEPRITVIDSKWADRCENIITGDNKYRSLSIVQYCNIQK